MNIITNLTARQLEVAEALKDGLSKKHVAKMFDITERTVEAHARNIYEITGVHNAAELGAWWNWKFNDIRPKYFVGAMIVQMTFKQQAA